MDLTIGALSVLLFAIVALPALVGAVGGLLVASLRRSRRVKGLWVGALVGAACGALLILVWFLFLFFIAWRIG